MYNFALEKGLKWLLSVTLQLERNIANIWLKTVINQISPINIPVHSIHFFELKIISIHLEDQISIF